MKVHKLNSLDLSDIQKSFVELYPDTAKKIDISKSQNLFSPFSIQLPYKFKEKINSFNQILNKIYKYKIDLLKKGKIKLKLSSYQDLNFNYIDIDPNILTCLDFHINPDTGALSLIEANTNASGYLIGSLVYKIHKLDFEFQWHKLKQMFTEGLDWENRDLYIMDNEPEKQKMYLEFLMYKEFFKNHGKTLNIIDGELLNNKISNSDDEYKNIGIYNRSTDFYLEDHPEILKLYLSNTIKINPHPIGYDLFAHKDNLHEWLRLTSDLNFNATNEISETESQLFQSMLLHSQPLQDMFADLNEAWNQRKKFFFKPSDSYGGKATYRGASISKKYFENAWKENFLAQTYCPAPKLNANQNPDWKFDVRVYVYQNEMLFVLARVYQGQTTNFNNLGGGFAPVTFY